ncbi:hypothetical protein D3C85_803530 [compost metagenome]
MSMVKEQLAVFPAASTTLKVLVVVPNGKTLPDASPDVCVIVIPEQLSVAIGVE